MAHDLVMNDASLSVIDSESNTSVTAYGPMDEDTFRAFYERTSRAVWVYLARVTGDKQLADDLLQDVFYRFFRANATHEDEAHRRNSLFCFATNIARDANRKRFRVRAEVVPIDPDDEDQALRVDERIAERFEASTDLAKAMGQLTPVQREMLWLAYALGSSHAEIAEMVGVRSGSVKILLLRARRKVASILGGKR
ncbi:MAG TPA: RNA polymerase sigma factor [Thermoanaerobaculia bacterium]|jgi:RNA polymerase sigma-70 factor (ECF subfamily)|nr:RNA polymerase sigma factor [Thermoanaerobaculia bacterium]